MTFKELLKNKNLKQQDIADKLGKSQKLISNWCRNICEPQLCDLLKLQQYLEVDIYELIGCFTKK